MSNKTHRVTRIALHTYEVSEISSGRVAGMFIFSRDSRDQRIGAQVICRLRSAGQDDYTDAGYAYFKDIKRDAEVGALFPSS